MNVERIIHEELVKFTAIVPESVIKLPDGTFWVELKTKSGSVEGKLYLPPQPNGSILLFEPDFPGDASTRLEQLWASNLVENGYAIFAARHSGTIINGQYSDIFLNCPERRAAAEAKNQEILGEKSSPTMADWLKEPLVMMEAFAPSYREVILAGHSFGALATLSSLIDLSRQNPELTSNIKRFVSLAGAVGRFIGDGEGPMKGWHMYVDTDAVRAKVRIGSKNENLEALRGAYIKIHEQASFFPTNMDFLFVVPWGNEAGTMDELVPPEEALDMISSLGRGYLILDQGEEADERSGRLVHDMHNLRPDSLVQLLNRNWLPPDEFFILP